MIKKYNVTVNGKSYQVEVEEVRETPVYSAPPVVKADTGDRGRSPLQSAPAAAPKVTAVPAGASTVTAPMPGTILNIKVKQGDAVKRGDVLLILEAMKMENEILAANDSTVAVIHVTQGTSVNTGDNLISLT